MNDSWGSWARNSSDKFLLVIMITFMLVYNLHIIHDKADDTQVQFMNGLINTTLGALIAMITSAVLRKQGTSSAETTTNPQTGVTKIETVVKEEEK